MRHSDVCHVSTHPVPGGVAPRFSIGFARVCVEPPGHLRESVSERVGAPEPALGRYGSPCDHAER